MRPIAVVSLFVCGCSAAPSPPSVLAPKNFNALFTPPAAYLAWDAVPGATGYRLIVASPPTAEGASQWVEQQFDVQGTGAKVLYALGHPWRFSVAAVAGKTVSARSNTILLSELPSFTVTTSSRSVLLQWDASLGSALVSRSPTPDSFTSVAQSDSGEYLESDLAPNAIWYWQVLIGRPPVQYLTGVRKTEQPPTIPTVSVSYVDGGPFLTWDAVPGAALYSISGATLSMPVVTSAQQFQVSCPGVSHCSFQVGAINPDEVKGDDSPPVSVTMPPAKPAAPGVTPGSGKALIAVPPLPEFGDHFIVESQVDGAAYTEAGSGTGPMLVVAASAWTWVVFRVRAVTVDGIRSLPSDVTAAYVLGNPDSANLTGDGTSDDVSEGQRITIERSGLLVGVELGLANPPSRFAIFSAGRMLATAGTITSGTATVLQPDIVTGMLFDLSHAPLAVSAGEVLDVEVEGALAATSAAAGGHHLRHGSLDAAHDLVYKAFVKPDATLAPPNPISTLPGVGAVRVQWNASPGALRYDVAGSDDGGVPQLIGSTAQPWFDDATAVPGVNRHYTVSAVGSAATLTASALFTASPLVTRAAAASLDDIDGAQVQLCAAASGAPTALAETFTAAADGVLDSLELGVESAAVLISVEVFDAGGNSLGSANLGWLSSVSWPFPLDPTLVQYPSFDLSALGISVRAGDVLTLRFTTPWTTGCATLRDGANTYAGGQEFRDGAAVPDRDLAFRVLVR